MKVKEISIEQFEKERTIYYKGALVLFCCLGISLVLFLHTNFLKIERVYQGTFQEDGLFHLVVAQEEVAKWKERKRIKLDGSWTNYTIKQILFHREERNTRELLLDISLKEKDFEAPLMSSVVLEKETCSVLTAIVKMLGGTYA